MTTLQARSEAARRTSKFIAVDRGREAQRHIKPAMHFLHRFYHTGRGGGIHPNTHQNKGQTFNSHTFSFSRYSLKRLHAALLYRKMSLMFPKSEYLKTCEPLLEVTVLQ